MVRLLRKGQMGVTTLGDFDRTLWIPHLPANRTILTATAATPLTS